MYVLCLNYSTCIFTVLLINTDFTKSSNGFVENRMETEMIISNIILTRFKWFKRMDNEKYSQGGHGTGKTGNLVLTFSRQGKHREFCSDTGKNLLTQGKYLDCDY